MVIFAFWFKLLDEKETKFAYNDLLLISFLVRICCTMDISAYQINSNYIYQDDAKKTAHQSEATSKPHSKAEINKALSLLGFNSWSAMEPSKILNLNSGYSKMYQNWYALVSQRVPIHSIIVI